MADEKSIEAQVCNLLGEYREILGLIRLIRDASSNDIDSVQISDINYSMNLLVRQMENANKNLDNIYDKICK